MTRYIVGGLITASLLACIALGHNGELKLALGSVIGFLFGQSIKR